MKKLILIPLMIVLATALIFGGCTTPAPEPTIELSFASDLPPANDLELALHRWAEKIQSDTNGRVHITFYDTSRRMGVGGWAGLMEQLKNDIDISHGITGMSPSPIARAIPIFFYGTGTNCAGKVYNELWKQFPEMRAAYLDIKWLFGMANPEHWVQTKDKPVRNLDDFKGLKLSGLDFGGIAGKLGANQTSMGGAYSAIEDGSLDGTIDILGVLPVIANGTSGIDVIQYATNLHLPLPPGDFFAMNLDKWNSLPPDIQKVFEDSSPWIQAEMEKSVVAMEQESIDLAKTKGIEFIELSSEDLNKYYGVCEKLALEKAAELDAQGYPGTKIFQRARHLIEEYERTK